jgi:hypothetical protein
MAGASVRDVLSLVKHIANRVGFVALQKREEQDKPAPLEPLILTAYGLMAYYHRRLAINLGRINAVARQAIDVVGSGWHIRSVPCTGGATWLDWWGGGVANRQWQENFT